VASYNLAEAKARFSELVSLAELGEEVRVTRRGRPAVRIVIDEPLPKRIDMERLRAHQARMPRNLLDDGSTVMQMRREARY
jgi:prevent-host-death family protein